MLLCIAFPCRRPFSSNFFFSPCSEKYKTMIHYLVTGGRKRLTLKCVASYCFHLLAPADCCHKSRYFPAGARVPSLPVYSPSIKHLQHQRADVSPRSPFSSPSQLTNLTEIHDQISGMARCPYNPLHNSTALITSSGELYAATAMDFSGRDPAIYRSLGGLPPLRTAQYNSKWLNGERRGGVLTADDRPRVKLKLYCLLNVEIPPAN